MRLISRKCEARTYENAPAESVARERLNAMVSAAFALSGLLLVSLGPHGLLTSVLAESTKKIINTPLVSTSRAA